MELDELINGINKEMKSKRSWLRLIAESKVNEPLLYINEWEFKNTEEYMFLHELAKYRILNEDCKNGRPYILFGTNSNTLKALNNPKIYFEEILKKE